MEQLQSPDTETLWLEMKTILDEKMPVNKKKRRFIFWLAALLAITSLGTLLAYDGFTDSSTKNNIISGKENSFPAGTDELKKAVHENQETIPGHQYKAENSLTDPAVATKTAYPVQSIEKNIPGISKHNDRSLIKGIFQQNIASAEANNPGNLSGNNSQTERPYHALLRPGFYNNPAIVFDEPKNELPGAKLNLQSLPPNELSFSLKKKRFSEKRWTGGLSLSYHVPVGGQKMSTVNRNGQPNKQFSDYLPAVYAQYHFNKKWSVQAEFQFNTPQYTSQLTLSGNTNMISPVQKEETIVSLNKLYYLNLPLSVHYSPLPRLRIGAGIQYSHLQHSLYTQELIRWEKEASEWRKVSTENNVVAVSHTTQTKKMTTGHNNGSAGTPPSATIDTVAQNLRSNDWRFLMDINYNLKRFSIGMRYTSGLNDYINIKTGNTVSPVQDRNKSFQLYIRYNLFDKRKS